MDVTLDYGARDEHHKHAVVLKHIDRRGWRAGMAYESNSGTDETMAPSDGAPPSDRARAHAATEYRSCVRVGAYGWRRLVRQPVDQRTAVDLMCLGSLPCTEPRLTSSWASGHGGMHVHLSSAHHVTLARVRNASRFPSPDRRKQ